ncbi:MAG: hypothetical protein OXM61_10985 [Candidatus Poribacteria bacterium]|nr:hypothetical protein [Candidatus Poribacteria bacterium]
MLQIFGIIGLSLFCLNVGLIGGYFIGRWHKRQNTPVPTQQPQQASAPDQKPEPTQEQVDNNVGFWQQSADAME